MLLSCWNVACDKADIALYTQHDRRGTERSTYYDMQQHKMALLIWKTRGG